MTERSRRIRITLHQNEWDDIVYLARMERQPLGWAFAVAARTLLRLRGGAAGAARDVVRAETGSLGAGGGG